MKHKKEKFDASERRRKFSLRKVSGIGAVSAVIGVVSFSALPLDAVSASETSIKVNYKYATTDELTASEHNLIINELPKDLVDGSDLFVIYRKDSANNVLPNTGSNVLPLASVVGAGLLLVAYSIKKSGKTDKKIVKSMLSITIVGGALTVTTVSALTVATLANYNHTETVTAGAALPDGKMNIPGYQFVGYIDGKNVNPVEKAPTAALQGSISTTQPQEKQTQKVQSISSDDTNRTENKTEEKTPVLPEKTQDNKKTDTVVPVEHPEKEKDKTDSQVVPTKPTKPNDNNESTKPTTPTKDEEAVKPTKPSTDKNPVTPKDDEPVKPVDTKVIDRVVKVDESGNTLEDITGYTKVSTSQPVETREVQDGQPVIIRTVTEIYKKDTASEEKPAVDVLKETNLVVPSTLVEVLSEEVVEEDITVSTTPTETSVPVTPTVETPMPVENSTDTAPVTESSAEENKKEEVSTPVETPSTGSTPAPETTVKQKKVIRTVRTTEDLPFEVVVKEDSSLAEGEAKVEIEGKLGKKVTTQKVTLVDDVETAKETISETREEPQNKVVLIGTKKTATQPTASEVVTSTGSDATPAIETKEVTAETPLPGYYTVEVTESENKTVVTDREKVRELVQDRTPFLNLVASDGEKLVQIKTIEIYDNAILEGQRQLQDIQASYVTVNVRKRHENGDNDQQTEVVVTKDIPLITKIYHLGTKSSGLSRKDVVVSGHAYDSNNNAIEEGLISIYKDNELITKVNTDFDGYMFTHLLSNQSYTLKADGFEAKVTAIPYGDPIIENIEGHFELGRKYSDDMIDYHLKSNVIYVDDGQYQSDSDDGKKVVLSKEINARVGDILVIPPSKIYETSKAIKITSISTIDNQSVIEYSVPSLYEVIQNINTKAWSSDISSATFIPAEGVTVEKEANTDGSLFRSVLINQPFPTIKVPFKGKTGGDHSINGTITFDLSGKVWSNSINIDNQPSKIDFMNFDINHELAINTSGKITFSTPIVKTEPISLIKEPLKYEFPLGHLIVPTPAPGVSVIIPIEYKTTFDGKITVSLSDKIAWRTSIGLRNWIPKSETVITNRLEIDDVDGKIVFRTGPELRLEPNFWGLKTISVSGNLSGVIDTVQDRQKKNRFHVDVYGEANVKGYIDALEYLKKIGMDFLFNELKTEFLLYKKTYPFKKYVLDIGENLGLEVISNPKSIFEKLTNPFIFSSGGGGWFTTLSVGEDGSIIGAYKDSNMGDTGPNHPNGQMSISNFTGKFTNLEKVSDYEYNMTLTDLDYPKPGISKIVNGIKIDTTDPYGITGGQQSPTVGKNFVLYLPGRPVKDLPKEVGEWIYDFKKRMPEKLTSAVIFNKEKGFAFVESDQPNRKVSSYDETIIQSIVSNSQSPYFYVLLKPKNTLNRDGLYVNQFKLEELLDYYNTYRKDTYQKADIISDLKAQEVNESLKNYGVTQWRKLYQGNKIKWFYSKKDDALFEVRTVGNGGFDYGVAVPVVVDSSNNWKVTDDGVEVTTLLNNKPYQTFLLKKNNKKYDGGSRKTPYYISKVTNQSL